MPPWVFEAILSVVILGLTYALYSEGLWGAALVTLNLVVALLVALNFYEPLAALIDTNLSFLAGFGDVICLGLLFLVTFVALKAFTENVAPTMVRFPAIVDVIGRISFALLGALITAGVIVLLFHVAPVSKKIFGAVDYQSKPPFGAGLDHKLLAFFQWSTGKIFTRYPGGVTDPFGEFGGAAAFDPRGDWLIRHQNARPAGDDVVPEPEAAAPAPDPAAGGAGAGGPGMQPPGGPGAAPPG